jgi:membrane protein required for colicin V production
VTIFDYLVIFVLLASVVIGIMRGLVKEVLSLGSWIIAFVVANTFAGALARLLPEVVPGDVLRLILAFIALFIGARILMGLLILAIDALITAGGLTFADRGLGSLFGLARGILIVLVAVILCGMTSIPQQDFWTHALLSPLAESGARAVKAFLPESMARHIQY